MEELAQRLDRSVFPVSTNFTPDALNTVPDILPQTSDVSETTIETDQHENANPPLFAADWDRKTHPTPQRRR